MATKAMTRRVLTATLAWGIVSALSLLPALAQEIAVVDSTGVDTHHITLRVRVDEGILILTGKLNRYMIDGKPSETLPGSLILRITLEDSKGARLDRREVTIGSNQLGLALEQPIGRTIAGLAKIRVERVTGAELHQRWAAEERKRAQTREAAIRAKGWPHAVEERVLRGDVWVGMTTEQARHSRGEPSRITETITAAGRDELWTYSDPSLALHFRNGTATMIQRTR